MAHALFFFLEHRLLLELDGQLIHLLQLLNFAQNLLLLQLPGLVEGTE